MWEPEPATVYFWNTDMEKPDLKALGLRALNEKLQSQTNETNQRDWEIINPRGSHAIAVGVDAPINVTVWVNWLLLWRHEQAGTYSC